MTSASVPAAPEFREPRRDTPNAIRVEIAIVLLITLGMSGLRSIVSIIEDQIRAAQAGQQLSSQAVAVVAPQSDLNWIDLIRQLLSITQAVTWGVLGLYLLWRSGLAVKERFGLDLRHPWRDLASGAGLAAFIGVPGLGLYLVSHALGFSLTVVGSNLTDTWWRLPVSILAAIENGFLEEVLVVAYLITRLQDLRVRLWVAVAASALLRGSYHLYQGYGGFVGNAIMGVIFALVFLRWRRLWPLVIAHSLIDIVVFVAYPLLQGKVSWLP
ncbi:CPBP family intramembrane metalloprotease [Nakamurella sp. YIM 132087]|uniref:CPBP family intramembrane metalloprotease n=1 Tax=Nakamurella alba TaxID=2665158 RepID=A0A7K1FQJ2_9ACTN|nr:type II CAAX endopeptidase family protein [Nakamurella alba]MTD15629.1 CPBP family intramembrane metalloprotease [Nakamurella alba]